ncbi:hypothetical protein [Nostoc cycadae]|uniref:HTH domain-containing protein n=1 Tax=Nostoc cycadae WK-1 TaxID=1861711 RepID=A0A2H6LRA1_9NOSO|nr:hypothetical protein [Nostoc cycadae]GBE95732.1 HTH domain-containing protein [Nostoc cycadae WK-1]
MKINGDFYPLTPETSRKLRQGNLTAAEWRIWSYLVELDSWGDRYQEVSTLRIIEECNVSKATFYRAVAKLQELEIFDFQDIGFSIRNLCGVTSLKNETTFSEMRQDSQKCDSNLKNEKVVSKVRNQSQKCENQQPEPLQKGDSATPQINKTYSNFKDSLSEAEREDFLNFSEQKSKQLPTPPTLISKWIAANWEDLAQQWQKSRGKTPPVQNEKWENHPCRGEWLAKINELGSLGFQTETDDKSEQATRRQFAQWAVKNNLIGRQES